MAKGLFGIFIGSEELKAVVLKPTRKGYRLAASGVHDLAPDEREKPGSALRALLKKVKGHPDRARFALPNQHATIHQISLPSTEADEIASMARFEMERHIPFNAERHCIGYQVLGEGGIEGTPVLLAAIDGPHVDRALAAAADAKLGNQGVNVSSACQMNALFHLMPEVARNKTIASIYIGMHTLDFVFAVAGRIVFTRSVPHGLTALVREWIAPGMPGVDVDRARAAAAAKMIDLMDLEKNYAEGGAPKQTTKAQADAARSWLQRVIVELRRSYDYARREMRCPPIETVILMGEGAILRNLPQYLYVNLNVEIAVANPGAGFGKSELKNLPFGGLELTPCFGAAIQGEIENGYEIDLTPPAHYRAVEKRRLVRNLVTTGVLTVIAASLGAVSYLELKENRTRLANAYTEVNELMSREVRELREKEKQFSILQAFFDDPSGALPVLNHVCGYAGFPSRITIREIRFEKTQERAGETIIRGYAKENEDLTGFYDYLNSSGLFEGRINPRSRQKKKAVASWPEVYEFEFVCQLPEFDPEARRRSSRKKESEGAGESGPPPPGQIAAPPGQTVPPPARKETNL